LIRLLRLAPAAELHSEVAEARRLVLKSTLDHLAVLRRHDPSGSEELYDDLAKHYEHRLASVSNAASEQDEAITQNYFRHLSLSRDLLQVERQTVLKLRAERRVSDEVLRDLEHELDLSETRLAGSTVS
jgi:CPA1 family monovalent cation:H+ antiporter